MKRHTPMPRTGNPAISRNDTELQRRPVVRALGAHGVDLAVEAEDKDLAVFDALDIAFDFFLVLDRGEGGDVFESVFGHFES